MADRKGGTYLLSRDLTEAFHVFSKEVGERENVTEHHMTAEEHGQESMDIHGER